MPIGSDLTIAGAQFILTVDGIAPIRFTVCQNLGTKTEVVEQQVTMPDGRVGYRKLPGVQKPLNVVLKRPMDANMDLMVWRRLVESGGTKGSKRNGNIVVVDTQGREIARWDFVGGWPSKLASSILNGTEELILAVDTLHRV